MTPTIRKETAQGNTSCTIDESMFDRREVIFQGDVDQESAMNIVKQLMYLDREDHDKEITMYINSNGGEVLSGMAIYDTIQMIHAPVRTVCVGFAASMGAILFLAGEKREMLPHAEVMIHDPLQYGGGGKATDIQRNAEHIMKTRQIIGQLIADRTGQDLEVVFDKTARDTYFNAAEAMDFGLSTGILESF